MNFRAVKLGSRVCPGALVQINQHSLMCTSPDQLSDIISAYCWCVPCCHLRWITLRSQSAICFSVFLRYNPNTMLQQQLKVCDLHIAVVTVDVWMPKLDQSSSLHKSHRLVLECQWLDYLETMLICFCNKS